MSVFGYVWHVLNSHQLNYALTWAALYATTFFFFGVGLFMVALRPRIRIEKGFTWVILAMGIALGRFVVVRFYQRPTEFVGSLSYLNLLASIVYTSVALVRDKMVRRRAMRFRFRKRTHVVK